MRLKESASTVQKLIKKEYYHNLTFDTKHNNWSKVSHLLG